MANRFKDQKSKDKYKRYRGRRDKEIELWYKWKESGDSATLSQLVKSLDPLIEREARRRAAGLGGSMPLSSVKAELRRNAVQAIKSYNPDKGAKLQTHIYNNFMRSTDYITTRRNLKYFPRKELEKYQTYQNRRQEFIQEYGGEPSIKDMQKMLPKYDTGTLKRLSHTSGPEMFTHMGQDGALSSDPNEGLDFDEARASYLLMKATMTPAEVKVGDLLYPANNGAQKTVPQISRHLGMSEQMVYKTKTSLEKKMQHLMRNR